MGALGQPAHTPVNRTRGRLAFNAKELDVTAISNHFALLRFLVVAGNRHKWQRRCQAQNAEVSPIPYDFEKEPAETRGWLGIIPRGIAGKRPELRIAVDWNPRTW